MRKPFKKIYSKEWRFKLMLFAALFVMVNVCFGNQFSGENEFDDKEKVSLYDLKRATVRIVLSQKKDGSPSVTQTGVFLKDSQGEVHLITSFNGVLMLVNRPNPIEKLNISVYDSEGKLLHENEVLSIKSYDLKRDLISIDLSALNYKGPAVPFYDNFFPHAPCADNPNCNAEHKIPKHYSILGYDAGKSQLNAEYVFTHQSNALLDEYLIPNEIEQRLTPVIPSVEARVIQGISNKNMFGISGGPIVPKIGDSGKPFGIVIGGQETGTWIVPIVLSEFIPDSKLTSEQLALIQKQIDRLQQNDRAQQVDYCYKATSYSPAVYSRKGIMIDINRPFELIISALATTNGTEEDQTKYIYTAANLVNTEQDTYYGKDKLKKLDKKTKSDKYGDHYNTASFNLILGKYHLLEYRRTSVVSKKAAKLRGNLEIVVDYFNTLKGIYNENEALHLIPAEERELKKYNLDLTAEFTDFFNAVLNEVNGKQAYFMGEKAEARQDLKAAKEYYSLALDYQSCYEWKAQNRLLAIDKTLAERVALGYGALKRSKFDSAMQMLTSANALLNEDSISDKIAELELAFEEIKAEGDRYFENQQSDSSFWFYEKALRFHPNDPYINVQLSLLDTAGGGNRHDKLLEVAERYYKRKDYESAKIRYQQALALSPQGMREKSQIRFIDSLLKVEQEDEFIMMVAQEFQDEFMMRLEPRSGLRALPNCRSYYEISDTGFTMITSYGIEFNSLKFDPNIVQNYDNFAPGEITNLGKENFLKLYAESFNESLKKYKRNIDAPNCKMIIEGHTDAIKFEHDLDYDEKLYVDLEQFVINSVDSVDSAIVFQDAINKEFANRGLAFLRAYSAMQTLAPLAGTLNDEEVEILVVHDRINYGEESRKVVIRFSVALRK